MDRLPRKHPCQPVFLVNLLHQLQPEFLIARKPQLFTKAHHRCFARKGSLRQFRGRHAGRPVRMLQYIPRHILFMIGKIRSLLQLFQQHRHLLAIRVLPSLNSQTSARAHILCFPAKHPFIKTVHSPYSRCMPFSVSCCLR